MTDTTANDFARCEARRECLVSLVVVTLFIEEFGFCTVVVGIRASSEPANRYRLIHGSRISTEENLGRPTALGRCFVDLSGILEGIRRDASSW